MMLPGKLFSGFSGILVNFLKYEFGEQMDGWLFLYSLLFNTTQLITAFITLNVIISMIRIYRFVFLFLVLLISYAAVTPTEGGIFPYIDKLHFSAFLY